MLSVSSPINRVLSSLSFLLIPPEDSDSEELDDRTSEVGSNGLLLSSLNAPSLSLDDGKVTIFHLPTEVWGKIAEFCHSVAILRLLEVCKGNKALRNKVPDELDKSLLNRDDFESLNRVKIDQILEKHALLLKRLKISKPFKKWKDLKKIIDKCPNLENLEVVTPSEIDLTDLEIIPKIRVLSIKGLDWSQLPRWLFSKVETKLPESLESLKVPFYKNDDLSPLPCSLLSFSTYTKDLNDQVVKMLPTSLQELKLSCSNFDTQSNFGKVKELKNLKNLILKINNASLGTFNQFFLNLPSNLSIFYLKTWRKISENEVMSFPRSLKELTLHLEFTVLKREHIDSLPKTLEKLVVIDNGFLNSKTISHLPSSLLHLKVCKHNLRDENIESLPPSLIYLDLGFSRKLTVKCLSKLPRGLHSFRHMIELTNWGIKQLPPNLQILTFLSEKNSLDEKQLDNVSDRGLGHLPRGLIELCLSGNSKVTSKGFARLPRNLKTLEITLMGKVETQDLSFLPENLEVLCLPGRESESLQNFPRSLQTLKLPKTKNFKLEALSEFPFLKDCYVNDRYLIKDYKICGEYEELLEN
jgi:hypothetical protein